MYGKNINILYNYDTSFYHVMKMLINLDCTISFESYMVLASISNQKQPSTTVS